MNAVVQTLMIIPAELGILLGIAGILPALPALAGKSPTGWGRVSFIAASAIVGAIGISASMAHLTLSSPI